MLSEINIQNYILDKYVPAKLAACTIKVVYLEDEAHSKVLPLHGQQKCADLTFPFARSALVALPITDAQTLVAAEVNEEKRVYETTLDITNLPDWDYEPGDTIGILPSNTTEDVQQLLEAMQLTDHADKSFTIQLATSCTKKLAKLPTHIPTMTTPRELLRDCLNLRAVLKKQFLRALSECCSAADDREFLNCLSSKEASSQYNALMLEQGIKLLDLLEMCGTCQPTLALLIEHLPRLLPRPYSIANSALNKANEIKIMYSILTQRPGITTQMLETRSEKRTPESGRKILAYLRTANQFRYTVADVCANQILICIGTGVAPFIGFLEHKQHLATKVQSVGETWLFVGATSEARLPHRARLLHWQAQGVLNKYHESLSRVPDAPYHYVQELLAVNADALVELLLTQATTLYVCADGAHISKSIEAALVHCLQQTLELNDASAAQMLKDLRANGKYREDVWL